MRIFLNVSCHTEQGNILEESAVREKERRGLMGAFNSVSPTLEQQTGKNEQVPQSCEPREAKPEGKEAERSPRASGVTRARSYTYLLYEVSVAAGTSRSLAASKSAHLSSHRPAVRRLSGSQAPR